MTKSVVCGRQHLADNNFIDHFLDAWDKVFGNFKKVEKKKPDRRDKKKVKKENKCNPKEDKQEFSKKCLKRVHTKQNLNKNELQIGLEKCLKKKDDSLELPCTIDAKRINKEKECIEKAVGELLKCCQEAVSLQEKLKLSPKRVSSSQQTQYVPPVKVCPSCRERKDVKRQCSSTQYETICHQGDLGHHALDHGLGDSEDEQQPQTILKAGPEVPSVDDDYWKLYSDCLKEKKAGTCPGLRSRNEQITSILGNYHSRTSCNEPYHDHSSLAYSRNLSPPRLSAPNFFRSTSPQRKDYSPERRAVDPVDIYMNRPKPSDSGWSCYCSELNKSYENSHRKRYV